MNIAELLSIDPAWLPLFIFCARITDVSLGTMCMICMVRGNKPLAVLMSFLEILIWVYAASSVLTHLNQIGNVLGYAAGYATGRALGMWVESKLAMGTQSLTFISRGRAHAVAERLRFAGHCVTTLVGTGRDGPVAICQAIMPRKIAPAAIKMAREIDSNVMVTVEDVRTTAGGYMAHYGPGKIPTSWRWFASPSAVVSTPQPTDSELGTPACANQEQRPTSRAA